MKRPTHRTKSTTKVRTVIPQRLPARRQEFEQVVSLIETARAEAVRSVNARLIQLHWDLGAYISGKISCSAWGEGVVSDLAKHIEKIHPELRGFNRRNLFRMRQFYEAYRQCPIVSSVMTQLPWTHHLLILSKCEDHNERLFYIRTASAKNWSVRLLGHQIEGELYQRAGKKSPIVSSVMTQLHPDGVTQFKDRYLLDFIDVPDEPSERELQRGLMSRIKAFLMELGGDFCFVSEYVRFSVGERDFEMDLLLFNRALNTLVVVDLKTDRYEPEHLGKLSLYLEYAERHLRKAHENPVVGMLLCAAKDEATVEYSLSRSLSPALVAEYRTKLPDVVQIRHRLWELCGPITKTPSLKPMPASKGPKKCSRSLSKPRSRSRRSPR